MLRDPLDDARLEEIERRAAFFRDVPAPMAGDPITSFWVTMDETTDPGPSGTLALNSRPIRAALRLVQRDVPDLLAEIRRLRADRR